MIRLACLFVLCSAVAFAQVMTPGILPPGGPGVMVPNEGDMTPNAAPAQGGGSTCQGTGYDFTQACNSQYIVAL